MSFSCRYFFFEAFYNIKKTLEKKLMAATSEGRYFASKKISKKCEFVPLDY